MYSSICGKLCGISLWLLFSSWKAKFICYSWYRLFYWVFGLRVEKYDWEENLLNLQTLFEGLMVLRITLLLYTIACIISVSDEDEKCRGKALCRPNHITGRILHGKRRKMMTLRSHVHWTSSSIRAQKPISAFRRSRVTVYIRMNKPPIEYVHYAEYNIKYIFMPIWVIPYGCENFCERGLYPHGKD